MASKDMEIPHRSRGRLGSYELLRTLGVGGFGRVYLGQHIHLHSKAAVKVLHADLVDEQAEQFKHEAQMVAQLASHPHIVRVLDYNIQGGCPYIVMDYAPNGDLRQHHTFGERVPLSSVVSYVKQVASGLHHAHRFGVVHCDVKPENMFVGSRGEVLIGDFGIAIGLQEENAQSEDTFGTVPYMSPEQIRGNPQPASDQYALAVVAYEWLTGQRPFTGSDKLEIANKHLYEQPQSMRSIDPAIPLAVDQVVMKALAKDPSQRYPSIQAFAQALEAASQPGRAVPTRQTPTVVKSRRSGHPRHSFPYRVFLLLLILLIIFGLFAFAYWQFSIATVTITETSLTQTWGYTISATVGSNDAHQNPVAAHDETIMTPPQKNQGPATGEQHIQATQAQGEITFYNSDIVTHYVPAGTIITVPNSTLQVVTDEAVTIPAGDLSKSGQVNAQVHIVQAGADGNIAAHTLYGTICCSSDNIHIDNMSAFIGGQDDHMYAVVQQSDIHNAAKPLEASQMQNASTLLQKRAQPYEALVTSSVQCVYSVSPNVAVGSRANSVMVIVVSTCTGVFYNTKAVNSLVVPRYIDYEAHRLGNAYSPPGNASVNVTKAILLPTKNGPARLVLQVVATGVWHFNFSEMQKQRLVQTIAGKGTSQARAQLIRSIYKQGVNKVEIQITWNTPRFSHDPLPSDVSRIRLEIIQK